MSEYPELDLAKSITDPKIRDMALLDLRKQWRNEEESNGAVGFFLVIILILLTIITTNLITYSYVRQHTLYTVEKNAVDKTSSECFDQLQNVVWRMDH